MRPSRLLRETNAADPYGHWQLILEQVLPGYGHRNWIVVADAAYPAQCGPGIQTVVSDEDHRVVVERVLSLIKAAPHVRPIVHVDRELAFVDESMAPGIGAFRQWFDARPEAQTAQSHPHDEIIAKLDGAGQSFAVLIIKTTMTLPYTSVFFELDCAYWDDVSEGKLREVMRAADLKQFDVAEAKRSR